MNRVEIIFLAIIGFFAITSAGCDGVKEEEIPGMNVIGIRTSIERILISPVAFDAAIVALEGIARDAQEISEGNREITTTFKLFDPQGNFINVSIPGEWSISEEDTVIVGGTYRRQKNEIEAAQIEKIELEK